MATRQREKSAARIASRDTRPTAVARYIRITPSKVRIILDLNRGKDYAEAEAILEVQQAKAQGIKMIKEAGADESVIKLRSLEAFEAAADGQATKIIIPSDIQGLAGLCVSAKELFDDKNK